MFLLHTGTEDVGRAGSLAVSKGRCSRCSGSRGSASKALRSPPGLGARAGTRPSRPGDRARPTCGRYAVLCCRDPRAC